MEKVVIKGLILPVLFVAFVSFGQGVTPPLERVVSITLTGESSQESLVKLEEVGDFYFAYKTNLIPNNDQLNRVYQDQTVREVLDDMFQLQLTYKQKGNYIILKSAQPLNEKEVHIAGYIYDIETGEKIGYVSVYDSTTLISTLSDPYGYYSIELEKAQSLKLDVKRQGYHDTTMVWNGKENTVMDIAMRKIEIPTAEDTSSVNRFKFLKLSEEQKATINNFKELLKGKVQFSLIPSVGTNGKLSPVTSVDYSINLLGGFNQSVRKGEISAVFNMNYDTVQYFQAAGLLNLTGGYQRGVQLAGFTNLNNGAFKGVQMAGFMSLTKNKFNGFQGNGFTSVVLGEMHGVQAAGFGNIAGENSNGTQVAGALNYAGKNFEGVQLTSLINVARNMKGTQIALFNYNDSIEGVSLGLISISKQGLHQIEVAANDVTYANLSLRTGNNQFYNILSVGSRFDKQMTWRYGYGFGSSVRAGNAGRVFFDLEASGLVIGRNAKNTSILSQFTINYQYAFSPKIAIAIGPSLNYYLTQNGQGEEMRQLAPYSFYSVSNSSVSQQMWVGGKVALRFF